MATYQRHIDMANFFAAQAADQVDSLGERRRAYLENYEHASSAMTWCDVRGIQYADAAEAIQLNLDGTTIVHRA